MRALLSERFDGEFVVPGSVVSLQEVKQSNVSVGVVYTVDRMAGAQITSTMRV